MYKKKIHIFIAAWGAKYVSLATTVLFPSLLQEGNLPSAQKKHDIFLHIYCETSQIGLFKIALKHNPSKMLFVDVNSIDQFLGNDHKYGKMTACHRHFMAQIQIGAYAVFMHPDFFISNNLFTTLDSQIFSTDCACYFSHVLRISNEKIAELQKILASNKTIDSYQLTDFSLKNLLPLSKSYDIQSKSSSSWPIEVTANEDSNLFIYSYGMHPLAIRKDRDVDFHCFDFDMAEKMHGTGRFENFKAQRDNRNFTITELNSPNMLIGVSLAKKQSPLYCAALYVCFLPGAIRDFFFSGAMIYYSSTAVPNKPTPKNLKKFVFFIGCFKIFLKILRIPCERVVRWRIGSTPPYEISEQ